jgi:hypothetical protein
MGKEQKMKIENKNSINFECFLFAASLFVLTRGSFEVWWSV